MKKLNIKSVEPQVADRVNSWLKKYKLDYKLEQESLNESIDNALQEYYSKSGGKGGNRPDCKLLIQDNKQNIYPVLIEYKGYKDKLEKKDGNGNVENIDNNNKPNYKNIKDYAVNGAVHYANAILHYTGYKSVVAIGITGYIDSYNKLKTNIGVYLVSQKNFGAGQKIDEYSDLSFLDKKNLKKFFEKIELLQLDEKELQRIKKKREDEIDFNLNKLNNDIYKNEDGISERDRIYLVAASIMANLGIENKVSPLEKEHLLSKNEKNNRDGDIILKKVDAFLDAKSPIQKKESIMRVLENTLTAEAMNKVVNGETKVKRIFSKVVDNLGIYYKIGLTTDFTGKLFNQMYAWLGYNQDPQNDVVLTPSYVAKLLVKLARVDKDSYVWDFATGSAGLLVAAMNEMLIDAKKTIKSPNDLLKKEANIKLKQLLGIEILPDIHMLAVLNMILMGDGSTNILNIDSLGEFNGKYAYPDSNKRFPANAFILNPPYSKDGNGMVFVERALSMMEKGYASIIIQNSAGTGKAKEYNKRILKKNTLIASIKMPLDLFRGKSSVQTYIYVFRVGEAHKKSDVVKFIDFTNDGYKRQSKKKAKSSANLKNYDHAEERYQEIVDLVRYGKKKLRYYTKNEYFEGEIDPNNGADWNKTIPIDLKPDYNDIEKVISDYLSYEVSNILKKSKTKLIITKKKDNEIKWKEFKIKDVFNINSSKGIFHAINIDITDEQIQGSYPYIVRQKGNNGVKGYTIQDLSKLNPKNTISFAQDTSEIFFQKQDYFTGNKIKVLSLKDESVSLNDRIATYLISSMKKGFHYLKWGSSFDEKILKEVVIKLPISKKNSIDYKYMEKHVKEIEAYIKTINRK